MNKKILGLLFVFGIVAIPAQAADLNNELNAMFARRAARQAAAPQAVVNVDPVPVQHPAPVINHPVPQVVVNVDPAPVDNPIPQAIPEEIIDVDPVPVAEAEEIIAQQPVQAGGIRRFLGGIFGYPAPIVNNPEVRQDNPAPQVVANVNPAAADEENADVFQCSVCLMEISATADVGSGESLKQTSCGHCYHKECIDKWEDTGHDKCPLCQEPLDAPTNGNNSGVELAQARANERRLLAERDAARANQGGNTTLSTPKAIALVATGAATVSFIPGAPKAIKSGLTAATTKACGVACKYPKETAGIVAVTAIGCCALRGTNTREVVEFAKNNGENVLIGVGILTTVGMIAANK